MTLTQDGQRTAFRTRDMDWMPQYSEQIIEIDAVAQVRCPICRFLLVKGEFGQGTRIELKCPKCHNLPRFQVI